MTGHEVIDADVVDTPGTDLEAASDHGGTLFRTDDPVEVIERASRAADALKGVLTRQGLTQNIQGKAYVRVEGWTTLGSMLGVVPVCTWTRELPNGWEARVEARTLDGRVIGAAEAQCTKDERMWSKRDPYALRSMAQTRATSKALRGPLGFIVTLAGYEATPSEEIPSSGAGVASEPRQGKGSPDLSPDAPAPLEELTLEQYQQIVDLIPQAGTPLGDLAVKLFCGATKAEIHRAIKELTAQKADELIGWLKSRVVA